MYIIPRPRTGDCVIGGSDTPATGRADWSVNVLEGEAEAIIERAKEIDPNLTADPNDAKVGLRPLRNKGVRLGPEVIGGRTVIHNYGHGGSGFTVSWGCAEAVGDLVDRALCRDDVH